MESAADHKRPSRGADVLVLPYPLQGHINPILQFSKRLSSKGLKVTILSPTSIANQASFRSNQSSSLNFLHIFDGFDYEPNKDDLDAYVNRLKDSISQSLHDLLNHYKQNSTNFHPTPKIVIYDSFMPWVLDVVRKCGLEGAPFFTQSCLVNYIYYHFHKGTLITPKSGSDLVSIPSIKSLLKVHDMPSFVTSPSLYPVVLVRLILDQFSNLEKANCLFVNTVDKMETEVINWMKSQWPIKTIGPCIPSKYLDKRLPDDNDYGLSLFQPETDACIQWLDAREIASVVYISMGSMASVGTEQMEEIARALVKCDNCFLWVVRASEGSKLPLGFREEIQGKGLVVKWCPQLEVLSHRALGCFVTHCGWNSILEAISLGVPMVAFPQWTDQPTNAKCIADFWKIGVRVKVIENGFLTREELESCIREVMEGQKAKEIRSNATKWKQLVIKAMKNDGSSNRNIEEFVTKMLCP